MDSALAVITDPGDDTLVERIAVLAAAGDASPHARGLILVEMHTWLDWLEGWLRGRLPEGSSDLLVATYASTLAAAAEASFRVWARSVGTAAPHDHVPSVQDNLAATIAQLRVGLDPTRPAPTGARLPPAPAAPPDLLPPLLTSEGPHVIAPVPPRPLVRRPRLAHPRALARPARRPGRARRHRRQAPHQPDLHPGNPVREGHRPARPGDPRGGRWRRHRGAREHRRRAHHRRPAGGGREGLRHVGAGAARQARQQPLRGAGEARPERHRRRRCRDRAEGRPGTARRRSGEARTGRVPALGRRGAPEAARGRQPRRPDHPRPARAARHRSRRARERARRARARARPTSPRAGPSTRTARPWPRRPRRPAS